ncbi:hypothetical protein ACOSP7_028263 [Xanthoceras sorbifolium]
MLLKPNESKVAGAQERKARNFMERYLYLQAMLVVGCPLEKQVENYATGGQGVTASNIFSAGSCTIPAAEKKFGAKCTFGRASLMVKKVFLILKTLFKFLFLFLFLFQRFF